MTTTMSPTPSATSPRTVPARRRQREDGRGYRLREGIQAGERRQRRRSPNFCRQRGGGVCNPHTAPFPLIYPPCHWGGSLTMRAAYHLHAAPRLTSFTPPHWGGFFPASLTMMGAACNPHAAPFYFFSLLLVGGASFPRATRRRVTHTPPPFHFIPLPLLFGRGCLFIPPIDGGDPFK